LGLLKPSDVVYTEFIPRTEEIVMSWILVVFMLLLVLAAFLPLGFSLLMTWVNAHETLTEHPAADQAPQR